MVHKRWIALCLAVASGLWGCAPTFVDRMTTGPVPPSGQYREVIVGPLESEKLSTEARRNLAWSIRKKLLQEGVFQAASLGDGTLRPKASTVVLTGTIREFSEGDQLAQFFVGFGAGASQVEGAFELSDSEGNVLLSFTAKTSYAGGLGWGGLSKLTMEDLLERFASATAKQIAKWMKGETQD